MAWQLTIDNAQLTIQKIMIFQFSTFNSKTVTVTVVTVIFRRVVYE